MKQRHMEKRQLHRLGSCRGAAAIVEYTVVLPLCLFVVMFLLVAGYFLNERAVLDAAAHRSILIAQRYYSDPKFTVLADISADPAQDYVGYKRSTRGMQEIENDPYRFLKGSGSLEKMIQSAITDKAVSTIQTNRMFPFGDYLEEITETNVHVSGLEGILTKSITVTITEEYKFPAFLRMLGFQDTYVMQGVATTTVSAEPEVIRNIDMVIEIMEDFNADSFLEKVQGFFRKIGNFVGSLSGGEE